MASSASELAVPADYAGPSSVSGDHPQQYYVIQFCTGAVHGAFTASDISRLVGKSLFSDFFVLFQETYLYCE